MEENRFTWVPFFEELLDKICINNNPEELYSIWNNFFPDKYNSIDNDDNIPLNKIDPLSFLGKIISLGDDELTKKCIELKSIFNLNNSIPKDYKGIPRINRTNCLFWNEYWQNRTNKEDMNYLDYVISTLWEFAKDLNNKTSQTENLNIKNIDKILNFYKVGISKLSQIIFLVKPQLYYSCDDKTTSYLNIEITDNKDLNEFLEIQNICKSTGKTPYELSNIAELYSNKRKNFFKYLKSIENKISSYKNFVKTQINNEGIEREIFRITNKRIYDVDTELLLNETLSFLNKSEEWKTYNFKHGNGIPNAVLNTHYRNYILNVDTTEIKYWWLNADPIQWNMSELNVGEEDFYTYYNENGNKRRIFENFQNAKCCDLVIGYETHPTKMILSLLEISKNENEKLYFRKLKNFTKQVTLNEIKLVPELSNMECMNGQGSLFKLTKTEYDKIIEMTQGSQLHYKDNNENNTKGDNIPNITLNQILYGPPGTGKTYNTVIEAMKIIGSKKVKIEEGKQYTKDEYKLLKEEFDNAKDNHQIEFVTFHQSYSYEEFVEGIKPYIPEWGSTDNTDVRYIGENGIFKEICKNARQIKTDKTSHKIDFSKTRIFKMSLGANWENETEDIYNYCLTNNVVALGWGEDKDFSGCNISEEFKTLDSTWGAKAVEIFKNWMRVGDIILISNGNSNIKAIAQITGEYEYHNDREIRYCQFRNVNWLYNGDDIPVAKFYDKKLSQQAIYGFYNKDKEGKDDYNSSINTDVLNEIITGNINSAEEKPYILIIDEINRGNISKIFGELITLIESDKRENLTVTLPYSKEQFTVPKNLYIIGTMNTSDRSIASIDIALRRRFNFKEMMPNVEKIPNETIENINLKTLFNTLNERISYLLDRDHQIGHSYFMNWENYNIQTLKDVWFDSIMPLLNEYFYGDWDKLQAILGKAKGNESFIQKIKKPNLPFSQDCNDEDFYYDFVKKEEVNNNLFKIMLINAQFIEAEKAKEEQAEIIEEEDEE